jgi:ubiquitin-conjugating enzyme E2 Z
MTTKWDPEEFLNITPDPRSLNRRMKEIKDIIDNPIDGIKVCQDETLTHLVHVLIEGVKDTPYEGGFFYFVMVYPENYPFIPFKVKLMTTGAGSVRFNPNLYNCGKVCLSILGTWSGPEWSAAHNLRSTIVNLQTLFNETPLINEPGYEKTPKEKIDAYNNYVRHETMRVAVIDNVQTAINIIVNGMTDNSKIKMPMDLYMYMIEKFTDNFQLYVDICKGQIEKKVDGKEFETNFGLVASSSNKQVYKYETMLSQLDDLNVGCLAASVKLKTKID